MNGVSITLIRDENEEPLKQEKSTKGNLISETSHSPGPSNKMSQVFRNSE
mgnify:CR=1 FL=1